MAHSDGIPYVFCVACGCVAVHDGIVPGPHYWIERQVEEEERRVLAGIVCNACQPLPDRICGRCCKIGTNVGHGYAWTERRPTKRELRRLEHTHCPGCAVPTDAANAP